MARLGKTRQQLVCELHEAEFKANELERRLDAMSRELRNVIEAVGKLPESAREVAEDSQRYHVKKLIEMQIDGQIDGFSVTPLSQGQVDAFGDTLRRLSNKIMGTSVTTKIALAK